MSVGVRYVECHHSLDGFLLTLASVAAATMLVALTSRPWGEYVFGLTICALVVAGVSVAAILRHLGGIRVVAPAAAIGVLALVVILPSKYRPGPRPIYEGIQHLRVAQPRLQRPGSVLVADQDYNELCNYLAYSGEHYCTGTPWSALRSQVTARVSVGEALADARATALYADASMLGDPVIAAFVAAPNRQGWRQIAQGSGPGGPWRVLVPLT